MSFKHLIYSHINSFEINIFSSFCWIGPVANISCFGVVSTRKLTKNNMKHWNERMKQTGGARQNRKSNKSSKKMAIFRP